MTRPCLLLFLCIVAATAAGCSAKEHRLKADKVAYDIIAQKQLEVNGETEPFTIERPSDTLRRRLVAIQDLPHAGLESLGVDLLTPPPHWPNDGYPNPVAPDPTAPPPWEGPEPVQLSLLEALQIGARNSRDYQEQKEDVFLSALDLDLAEQRFRNTFTGLIEGLASSTSPGDNHRAGVEASAIAGVSRRLESGIALTTRIGLDVAKLLTFDRSSSLGIFGDATIAIPLLRGSGRHIVTEPLTQAERNVVYAIRRFERFKRIFAVRIASEYLRVLQLADQVENAEQSYRRVVISTRRARRLAEAGELPPIQVDQAIQNELRTRDRWISSIQSYARARDSFNILLGLPTDAEVELEPAELLELAKTPLAQQAMTFDDDDDGPVPPADAPVELVPPDREGGGPMELDAEEAVAIALENRLDLRTAIARVHDAQRRVVVAADALRAGLDLLGTAAIGERRGIGSAGLPDATSPSFDEGRYAALLNLDLPLERTAERINYRESYIALEAAVRNLQALEDQIKFEIRSNLRELLQSRQSLDIQALSVAVAERRVQNTDMQMQAGRIEIRDVLEAQEALLAAQNAFTSALVNYRLAEWQMQRDMDVLEVDHEGLWHLDAPAEERNDE